MVLDTTSTSGDVLNVISSVSPANSTFHLAPQSTSAQKHNFNSPSGASEEKRLVILTILVHLCKGDFTIIVKSREIELHIVFKKF